MSLESKLSNFCRLDMPQCALSFLKEHLSDRIDVFYKNAQCFEFAIDRGQCDLFGALLNYYKETRLDKNQDQAIYRKALLELQERLHYLQDNCVTSVEIRDLMREYISFDVTTDLIDIKIKTSYAGLRVPCLDNIDLKEEVGDDYVQLVLIQLRDMAHSLGEASKAMYIARAAEQSKVISESIELLENQYDLEGNLFMEEEVGNEQDLSGFEDVLDEFNHSAMIHKSHSESDIMAQHQQTDSKLLLHSSSESLLSALDLSGSDDTHEAGNLGNESGLFAEQGNQETL
jgi:hypothetical protein